MIGQPSEVPPSTIPETAEQRQALETASLELNREDKFLLLARFIRDLSHFPWCHDIFDTPAEKAAFPTYSSGLGYCLQTKLSKGNADENLMPCFFHFQT